MKPSFLRVLKDQRKIMLVAARDDGREPTGSPASSVSGGWPAASSAGVLLGLVNHLATEWWLLKIISSGAQPTKGQLAASTILRLTVLTVVAIGIAIAFWPDGIGLLLGLAIFRLIALVMTTIPLLKELKNQ